MISLALWRMREDCMDHILSIGYWQLSRVPYRGRETMHSATAVCAFRSAARNRLFIQLRRMRHWMQTKRRIRRIILSVWFGLAISATDGAGASVARPVRCSSSDCSLGQRLNQIAIARFWNVRMAAQYRFT